MSQDCKRIIRDVGFFKSVRVDGIDQLSDNLKKKYLRLYKLHLMN